jgi:osmotically inducible lipoprotein OsmB
MFNGLIREGLHMNTKKKLVTHMAAIALILCSTACANMSSQNKNTAVGAGAGAVLGAVLTGGSAVGTVGGAAVGGVIGNQIKR